MKVLLVRLKDIYLYIYRHTHPHDYLTWLMLIMNLSWKSRCPRKWLIIWSQYHLSTKKGKQRRRRREREKPTTGRKREWEKEYLGFEVLLGSGVLKEEKWKWGLLTFVFDWLVYQTCLMKARTPVSTRELLVVYPLPRVCVYLGEILRGFLWLGIGGGYVGCTNLGGMGFGA